MQDLNDKITGNFVGADEWNQIPSEIQNIIEATGQTLSGGNLNQLGIGVAAYVANGTFYTDSGAADAYVLTKIGSKQAAPAYTDGLHASFNVDVTNTGASTVDVDSLGVKDIVYQGAALNGGELTAGLIINLRFDTANDRFELIPNLSNFIDTSGNWTINGNIISATDSTFDFGSSSVRWANGYFDDLIITTSIGTNTAAQELIFKSDAGTEGCRLDSSQIFLVGKTTSVFSTAGIELKFSGNTQLTRDDANVLDVNRLTSDGTLVLFYQDTSAEGSISISGTTTAYNTSSDYRKKENDIEIIDGIKRINKLRPIDFNFIKIPNRTIQGFLAHEVQKVCPMAVQGRKDAVDENGNPDYQQMDASKLIPILTAAIKELSVKVEILESQA